MENKRWEYCFWKHASKAKRPRDITWRLTTFKGEGVKYLKRTFIININIIVIIIIQLLLLPLLLTMMK